MPGVGEKSAQRLAFFFLSKPQAVVHQFAEVLTKVRDNIRYCEQCYNLCYDTHCHICQDPSRDTSKICVVAEPSDIVAIEKTNEYKGLYMVLGGLLSPIDGIHPETLRIPELIDYCKRETIKEIIFAINPTIEGDATLLYLTKILAPLQIKQTKLAYGLPVGADIDYTDEMTLQRAFSGRTSLHAV